MISKVIAYTGADGVSRNEEFMFNLNEAELMELNYGKKGGLMLYLKEIASKQDGPQLMKFAKDFILMAYGVKSPDGRGFVKNDAVRQDFASTEAFSKVFVKFITDDKWALEFMKGVIPSNMASEINKKLTEENKTVEEIAKEELYMKPDIE